MSAITFQTLTPKQKADYTDRVWWEEMGKNPDNEVILPYSKDNRNIPYQQVAFPLDDLTL
jgi:hypothetical protein